VKSLAPDSTLHEKGFNSVVVLRLYKALQLFFKKGYHCFPCTVEKIWKFDIDLCCQKQKKVYSVACTQPILEPLRAEKVDFAKNMPAMLSHTGKNKSIYM
jgi:hypothetical protein